MPVANLFFENFKRDFITNFNLLKDFYFTFDNPVFWIFTFLLFLVLLEIWDLRNAFSFTAIVTTVLLLATEAEKHLAVLFSRPGESFDPYLMRAAVIFSISILFLLYSFMKK